MRFASRRLRNGSGVEVRAAVGLCCAASPQGKESKRRKGDLRRFVSATNGTSGTSSSTRTAGPRSPTSMPAGISPPGRRPGPTPKKSVTLPSASRRSPRPPSSPSPSPRSPSPRRTRPGPTDSSDVPSEREHHVCELTLRRTGVRKGHRSLGKMLPLEPEGAWTCLNGRRILLEVIPILSRS